MAKKWLVVMAMWLMGVAYGNAQEVVWSVDFDSHFANREGCLLYTSDAADD